MLSRRCTGPAKMDQAKLLMATANAANEARPPIGTDNGKARGRVAASRASAAPEYRVALRDRAADFMTLIVILILSSDGRKCHPAAVKSR